MTEKILMVADGIIVLINEGNTFSKKNISFAIAEFGVELITDGGVIPLPGDVLEHLSLAENTLIHVYEVSPFSLVGEYCGHISLDRDELLKAKGGWEYSLARAAN